MAWVTLGALALSQMTPTVAYAGTATGEPAAFIRRFADTALATMRDQSLARAQQIQKLDELIVSGFDLERIGRLALGRYWKAAALDERAEFMTLFKAYVLASYSRRFDEYAGRKLRIAATTPAGEDAIVESYLEGGPAPVRLDWRLSSDAGGWRILDVMVEGVSLLLTYRNEFAAVVEKGGGRVPVLLAELRARVTAERAELAS